MAKEYIKRVDLENRLHALCAAQRITAQDAIDIAILPTADVAPVAEISDAVDEAIRILNAIRSRGGMDYSDYCELFDVISEIYPNCGADMREVQDDD